MGNHCIAEVTIEEDDEVFAKSSIQASNLNHFFSQKYKVEADEDYLQNLIDQIEPGFSVQFEMIKRKKRIRGGSNFESVIYNKDNNLKKLKPSLKQISHNSIFMREHSNKTVRWGSQCYQSDSFKQ
ncbi:unnamed protein product [Paramecium octaurelia]|uniref:Uncharacterized protein n=1 Tax=Paramecium octaurelia TaxID=43137 RepID=A0A8S1SSD4_PAROT|nr:unnamed protein product [Paramecium octaurelia]